MPQFDVWSLKEDITKYNRYLKDCTEITAYHLTEYLLAEAAAEDGITMIFLYQEGIHYALFPGIVRKINDIPYLASELSGEVYDMITPHEYSGIISNTDKSGIKQDLLARIRQHCLDKNIIFGFVRINPYLKELPQIFEADGYDVILSCRQVYIDLVQAEEEIVKAYRSNVKRNIKRAQREELAFEIAEKNDGNIDIFQRIYVKAMEILEARRFLYFNEEYFRHLISCECAKLGFVRAPNGNVVASGIILVHKNTAYYHLGCFDREYSSMRPMNYLIHSMIMWSKQQNCKVFHLAGGGKSLMQFKEGYSHDRVDYYIAVGVFDKYKYEEICNLWEQKFSECKDVQYFPPYRYNE